MVKNMLVMCEVGFMNINGHLTLQCMFSRVPEQGQHQYKSTPQRKAWVSSKPSSILGSPKPCKLVLPPHHDLHCHFLSVKLGENPNAGRLLLYVHCSAKLLRSTPLTFLHVRRNECVDNPLLGIPPLMAGGNVFGNTQERPRDVPDLPRRRLRMVWGICCV